MYSFTLEQRRVSLRRLVLLHIAIIAISNYLVQFPFTIFGIHNTWGVLSFPFIFVTTDLTVRIFGKRDARKIVFYAMFPALLLSYAISMLFKDGHWTQWSNLISLDTLVIRIVIASLIAYLVGQLLDILVFDRLRSSPSWYLAPAASSIFGCAMDTFCFFAIAFANSNDPFMANNWLQIATADYLFKLFINLLFFLPIYGIVLRYLLSKLVSINQDSQINTSDVIV